MNAPFSAQMVQRIQAEFAANEQRLMIDGRDVAAASEKSLEVIDPATGQVFARVGAGDSEDIDRAVGAARGALVGKWALTVPAERARLLNRLADLIERNAEEIAVIESLDNGMPFMLARFASVAGAIEQLRYNAGWATKIGGETITPSTPGEWLAFTQREPVGVVGAIVPWNFPFVMAVAKIAPALAAGCTVVLKPAEQSPLSAVRLGRLIAEAGFPDGVVNVVTGLGVTAGAALVEHPGVDKISFTGSTTTGKSIIRAAAGTLKRVSLELGGKSPVIVFGDADIERAIPSIAMGIFGNSGQICAAGSRLYVHESIYERVLEGVTGRAEQIRVGAGLSPGAEMGPLISDRQLERVLAYIQSAAEEGASLEVGGKRLAGEGYFVAPTVLAGTAAGMKVVDEEIFGPVLCAMRFGDDDLAAISARANASEYGLSATVWTRDISVGLKMAKRIAAGTVRINGGGGGVDPAIPMGGYKQSGWGRENGRAGIEAFTEIKSVTVAL